MQNTNDTIRAKLDQLVNEGRTRHRVWHFALKQTGINLDFYLERFYGSDYVSFHYFHDFESLITVCLRYPVDAIIIGSRKGLSGEVELVHSIKQNVFLAIVPVIMYHPEPEPSDIIAAYQNGVEDFIHGEWIEKLVEVRIRRVIETSRRDLAVNPSTCLPGPTVIEREITRLIRMEADFAVCYADLDNFKAYNDYYGYHYGDSVIKLTARVIKDVVFDLCRGGFVGHVAGDDFMFTIPTNLIDPVCTNILQTFDSLIPWRYEPADRHRGYIRTINRRGRIVRFDILTLSIAVLINSAGKFSHLGEMSRMLADLKKATKARSGSTYMVERRQKY